MRDHVIFAINGREHRAGGREIYTTLANWLRYDACATGTKIVCEEGDCGACTVLICRAKSEEFVPVNSCILALCQLDGASIITIEDAVRFKAENPGCAILQGGTDVGVWINKRHFKAPAMLFLGKIAALSELSDKKQI